MKIVFGEDKYLNHPGCKRLYKDYMHWTGREYRIFAEEGDTVEDLEAKAKEIVNKKIKEVKLNV